VCLVDGEKVCLVACELMCLVGLERERSRQQVYKSGG
jgi:hypothetical protein